MEDRKNATELVDAHGSTETRDFRQRPICREAAVALGIAVLALALAIYGCNGPHGALSVPQQGPAKMPVKELTVVYAFGFILPIPLGIIAASIGGHSFRRIERSEVALSGDGFAFFSIMIGLFAMVIGVCTTFAGLIWP